MKAIILDAGRGSRMQQLTDEGPKCLLKVGGQTLIERQLEVLRDAGIGEIGIVTGYMREQPGSVEEIEGQYMGLLRFISADWSEFSRIRSTMSVDAAAEVHKYSTKIVIRGKI